MVTVGACLGSGIGALFWWSVYKPSATAAQSAPAIQPPAEEVGTSEVKVEEPKPNLIPVGYRKLFITYNPTTKTFTEADSGIPAVAAQFSNAHERGKAILEAQDIRARVIFEPSEFYEKLSKGENDAEKTTTDFATVHEGIWLNEENSVVHFTRGETKTLILAVQMQEGGFGGFDAFEHSYSNRSGVEIYLPRIPKLTADKYVLKVVVEGGAGGDLSKLFHFTLTLRPEFNLSRG
jgi:hypothetical protein